MPTNINWTCFTKAQIKHDYANKQLYIITQVHSGTT